MSVQNNTPVTKKTLLGQDFCKCPPCEERQNAIYPTTSDDQVIINKAGNTLEEWLNVEEGGSVNNSLKTWLQNNWSMSHYVLPEATTSTLGGVIIDPTYLTIENGRLSIDIQHLNIPEIVQATFQDLGVIRLGNSTTLTSSFIDVTIGGQQHDNYSYTGHVYAFPLRLDSNGRAGIAIPTSLFSEGGSEDTSVWTLDYSKKVENVVIDPVEEGVNTNYVLLGNKNVSTNNGELGYDSNGNLSTGCGYPRLALVAGTGVHFQRYTNRFISPADNYWGDNITELVISSEPPEVYNDFIGSDGYNAGEHGLVPAPAVNDNNKFLKGDGTWGVVGDGLLTIKYGTSILGTFSANTPNNEIIEIPVGLRYEVVSALPTQDISTTTIYLVPRHDTEIDDIYDEYMYINNAWELLGTTHIPVYTAGEGIDITGTVVSQTVATNNTLGGIRVGYTPNGNKKPVEIVTDSNSADYLKAFVDTDCHVVAAGLETKGLSLHYFNYSATGQQDEYTADNWMPIASISTDSGKCSLDFEIYHREAGKTGYARYDFNYMVNVTEKLACLSFYSEDNNYFDYDDIKVAKYINFNSVQFIIFKKIRPVSNVTFYVNILAEDIASYSTQHYFYTNGESSIADPNYELTSTDLRIGTYNSSTQQISARLINDSAAIVVNMSTISPENGTFVNSFTVMI